MAGASTATRFSRRAFRRPRVYPLDRMESIREDGERLRYSVVLTPVRDDPGFEGWYYAYLPALDVTTHGEGVEGALAAARDAAEAWVEARREHGEPVPKGDDSLLTQIEIGDALHAA